MSKHMSVPDQQLVQANFIKNHTGCTNNKYNNQGQRSSYFPKSNGFSDSSYKNKGRKFIDYSKYY